MKGLFFTQIKNELTYKRRNAFVQRRSEKVLPLRRSVQPEVKCPFPMKDAVGKHRGSREVGQVRRRESVKHQRVLQAEGYCMTEDNLRWMVRNVDVCATYKHVFAL